MKCEIPVTLMERVKACETLLKLDNLEYEFEWGKDEEEAQVYRNAFFAFPYRNLDILMLIKEDGRAFFQASSANDKWLVPVNDIDVLKDLIWNSNQCDICFQVEETEGKEEGDVFVSYALTEMHPKVFSAYQYASLVKAVLDEFLLSVEVFDIDFPVKKED